MIDLHSHILPGLDDGPAGADDAIAMAREAVSDGTEVMVATPHVNWRYPTRAADIAERATALQAQLDAGGVALQLRAGAEVAMTRLAELPEEELRLLTLGDGPWVLVEPPFAPVLHGLRELVQSLQDRGHRVLLAHPERCAAFHREPGLLVDLVRMGALASVTAGALVGDFGERPRRLALEMLRGGLAHNVASDTHDAEARPPRLREQIERAGLGELAQWLTEDVPSAILAGAETAPPRPQVSLEAPRRRLWRR